MLKCRVVIFLLSLVLSACSVDMNDLAGVYVAKNRKNTIDTLRVLVNGTYERDLYRKGDNSLVYHNTGKWHYKDGRITLSDFLLNDDQVFPENVGRFEDVLITYSLTVGRERGRVVIGYVEEDNGYLYEQK